jgi:hypothetical protein
LGKVEQNLEQQIMKIFSKTEQKLQQTSSQKLKTTVQDIYSTFLKSGAKNIYPN